MKTVGDHGLGCLDEESYAAVALAMQSNSNATNAALDDVAAQFAAYGNKYVFRFTTTTSSTSAANSGIVIPDGTAVDYIISQSLGVLPQGWYSAAASLSYQETGAVTAQSYRRTVLLINNSGALNPPGFFQSTTAASNTASADSAAINAWFYSNAVQSTGIVLGFGHGNLASTMTVSAGSVLTVRFLTTGLVV